MEKKPTSPLDDDHDLLNFDETGGRLRAEIAAVEAALAAFEGAGAREGAGEGEAVAAGKAVVEGKAVGAGEAVGAGVRRAAADETRLAALRAALERNSRNAAARPGETGFLTYVPPGRKAPAPGRTESDPDGTAAPPER